jgi:hypothetical protein
MKPLVPCPLDKVPANTCEPRGFRGLRQSHRATHHAVTGLATFAVATMLAGAVIALAQAPQPQTPNPNSQYRLGPDSMPQEGVPKGEIRGPFTLPSKVFPGTQHTYWVYVPRNTIL